MWVLCRCVGILGSKAPKFRLCGDSDETFNIPSSLTHSPGHPTKKMQMELLCLRAVKIQDLGGWSFREVAERVKHANVCRAGTCSPKYLNPGAWELGLQVNPRPITCLSKVKRRKGARQRGTPYLHLRNLET